MIENLVENHISRWKPLTIRRNEKADTENRHCDGKACIHEGRSYIDVMR